MSRKNREWCEHSYYHITSRGNHRDDIFRDESDFKMYLKLLRFSLNYFEQSPYQLLCYCLMDNHVHLLIKCSTKAPGYLMSKINWQYARYFNKKYNYIGHLFQERYFSGPVSNDIQLLKASRYIHLNPVRAGIVSLPEAYVYSSYRSFIGLEKQIYTQHDTILNYFDSNAHEEYHEFVMRKVNLI